MNNVLNDRTGERKLMNCGEYAIIIKYINNTDITIKFEKTGEVIKTWYKAFKSGEVKSKFTPTVFNKGIIGNEVIYENGKMTNSYNKWVSMLDRCYNIKRNNETYKDCKVCSEWLFYPNFKKWYDENYYEVNDEVMSLDKDILHKGNKIYCPDNCIFVPQRINTLFIKSNAIRGKYPIGVTLDIQTNKFIATCKINNKKKKFLGRHVNINKAFEVYKEFKEKYIKEVADEYRDIMPNKLYEAMYRYKVDITD